jgi:hypothetical protein
VPLGFKEVIQQSPGCVDEVTGGPPPIPIALNPTTFQLELDRDQVPQCLVGLEETVTRTQATVESIPDDAQAIGIDMSQLGPKLVQAGKSIPSELMAIAQEMATVAASGAPVDALTQQQQKLKDAQKTLKNLGLYLKEIPRYLADKKVALAEAMDELAGKPPRRGGGGGRSTGGAMPGDHGERRVGRVMVRYPVAGYSYSITPSHSTICESSSCEYFPSVAIGGADGGGLVGLMRSFGAELELFPIEYVGLSAEFETWGYSTDYQVLEADGSLGKFGDDMAHVRAGALGRLPTLRDNGPLDLMAGLGYHAQEFLFFHALGEEAGTMGWTAMWAHGFYVECQVRYLAGGVVQPHVGWRGTLIGSGGSGGFGTHDLEAGVTFRIYKGIVVDVQYQFKHRRFDLVYEASETLIVDHAVVEDQIHGAVFGIGYAF